MNLIKEGVFIIAELSANHNGSIEIALETVRAAKRTGADAIKIQTYTADTITLNCRNNDFLISDTIWNGKYLYELYKEAYTPWEWHEAIFNEAKKEGLTCFSSPFDFSAVDFLETLNCPIYKIASFEITDIPLIEYVASKGKPIIISTGIAEKQDIELALEACRNQGNNNITLLKCTSSYPAPMEEANLNLMKQFAVDYDVNIGLSDHTLGFLTPVIATALGAKVIEKHFILNHTVGGPDASFSLDEKEFKEMVEAVRKTEKALGNNNYQLTSKQKDGKVFSRSLYPTCDIQKGDRVTFENIKSVRPGHSLHPKHLNDIIGKSSKRFIPFGDRISLSDFE